jgi:hypothetical protein
MTDEKIYGELIEINRNVGSLTAEVKNFRAEYEEGKTRARACAKEVNEKIDDVRVRMNLKVDKREVSPLLKLNWVMQNWKIFVAASAMAGAVAALMKAGT